MGFALRRLAAGLCLLVAAAASPALADPPFTAAQTQAIDGIIHDYLMQHPEVIVQSVKAAQAQDEAAATQHAGQEIALKRRELLDDADSPIGGNPQGNVTIVEFFDYRCPYCKEVQPSLDAFLKQDGKVRIVYKEFPILGPASVFASKVALAARQQGKYAAFHDRMMAQKGTIDDQVVLQTAAAVGLDMAKLKTDMAAPGIERIITSDYALARDIGIDGTPAFIVGDLMLPGVVDVDALRQVIAQARQHG